MTENNYPEPLIRRYGDIERAISDCDSRPELVNGERAGTLEELIWQRINKTTCEVLSLDVFDTLLLRNNKSEAKRFYELSSLILDNIDPSVDDKAYIDKLTPSDLYLSRSQSMQICYRTARSVNESSEGNINDVINCQLRMMRLPQHLRSLFLNSEISYEIDNLICNTILRNIISRFQQRGGKIILISDMYLGRDILETLLDKIIPAIHFDSIFSSADTLVNKRSKTIFRYIESNMDKVSSDYLHIGDNWLSDVVNPRESGWQSMYFPVTYKEFAERNNDLNTFCLAMRKKGLDVRKWAKI